MGDHDTGFEAHSGQTTLEGPLPLEPAVARWLKISVSRDGRPVVQVSFPAYAVVNLADLVPDEVRPRVAESKLDLEQIAAAIAAEGCPPGEIFSLPGPSDFVRAWLE